MDKNNILDQLKKAIKYANKIRSEYGITAQEISDDDEHRLLTVSSNTTMEVDYKNKKGIIATLTGSFDGSITTIEIYDNNSEYIIQTDLIRESILNTSVSLSQENFNKLFQPGGRLYTLEVDELIPIESEGNKENLHVFRPSKKIIDCIPGYIWANYSVYKRSDNIFEITMIMKQKDLNTSICLMQYCFTKIEIIS